MTEPELKPCPCCGGAAKLKRTKKGWHYVECDDDCVQTRAWVDRGLTIRIWNTRADLAPAPLLAPDRVGIWACHTNSNGSVWVVPVEGAKPVQLRSDFDEGIERWYWLSEPDTQEQDK